MPAAAPGKPCVCVHALARTAPKPALHATLAGYRGRPNVAPAVCMHARCRGIMLAGPRSLRFVQFRAPFTHLKPRWHRLVCEVDGRRHQGLAHRQQPLQRLKASDRAGGHEAQSCRGSPCSLLGLAALHQEGAARMHDGVCQKFSEAVNLGVMPATPPLPETPVGSGCAAAGRMGAAGCLHRQPPRLPGAP